MEAVHLEQVKYKLTSLEKLQLATRKLFVEKGYDNTRPQDIAREAGLANGTFYLHFRDKKEAFLDFAEKAQADLLREFSVQLDGVLGRKHRWLVIFEVIERFAVENPGVLKVAFLDPALIAPQDEDAWRLYDRMGEFVFNSLNERADELQADYNLELISHAICGMMRQAMIFAARKKIGKEKMISDLITLLDKGLFR